MKNTFRILIFTLYTVSILSSCASKKSFELVGKTFLNQKGDILSFTDSILHFSPSLESQNYQPASFKYFIKKDSLFLEAALSNELSDFLIMPQCNKYLYSGVIHQTENNIISINTSKECDFNFFGQWAALPLKQVPFNPEKEILFKEILKAETFIQRGELHFYLVKPRKFWYEGILKEAFFQKGVRLITEQPACITGQFNTIFKTRMNHEVYKKFCFDFFQRNKDLCFDKMQSDSSLVFESWKCSIPAQLHQDLPAKIYVNLPLHFKTIKNKQGQSQQIYPELGFKIFITKNDSIQDIIPFESHISEQNKKYYNSIIRLIQAKYLNHLTVTSAKIEGKKINSFKKIYFEVIPKDHSNEKVEIIDEDNFLFMKWD